MDLAELLAKGVSAEVVVRTVAEMAEADWQENLTRYGDPAATDRDRTVAWGRLLGIAPFRALVCSAVEIWDREPIGSTPTIHIVDSR